VQIFDLKVLEHVQRMCEKVFFGLSTILVWLDAPLSCSQD